VHKSKDVGRWVAPLPTIDPLVIKRSVALGDAFGASVRYRHWLQAKSGIQLAKIGAGVGVMVGAAQIAPVRRAMYRVRPSGAGPSKEDRDRSWFRVTFVGRRDGHKVVTRVSGGDPGYDETAKMIAECALCIATQRDELPMAGGVVTPASAMGRPLIRRLQDRGIEFSVLERG